ncbi:MAG: hypothetical protein ACK56F_09125, partial [bacterium]
MPVVRHPVHRGVHAHRRDDDSIGEGDPAKRVGRERGDGPGAGVGGAPLLRDPTDERGVAPGELVPGDALAAREQREREREGREIAVARGVLE